MAAFQSSYIGPVIATRRSPGMTGCLERLRLCSTPRERCAASGKRGIRRRFAAFPASTRQNDGYLNPAAGAQHLQRHILAVTANPQIDAGRAEMQIAQHHFVEKSRQARVAEADFTPGR